MCTSKFRAASASSIHLFYVARGTGVPRDFSIVLHIYVSNQGGLTLWYRPGKPARPRFQDMEMRELRDGGYTGIKWRCLHFGQIGDESRR